MVPLKNPTGEPPTVKRAVLPTGAADATVLVITERTPLTNNSSLWLPALTSVLRPTTWYSVPVARVIPSVIVPLYERSSFFAAVTCKLRMLVGVVSWTTIIAPIAAQEGSSLIHASIVI